MKLLVSFVIQGENQQRFDSDIVDFSITPPLYSPEPRQADIEVELVRWIFEKQAVLKATEKLVVLKTTRI